MNAQHSLSRRKVLGLISGAAASPFAGRPLAALADADGFRVIILADLHSAYERAAEMLAAIDAALAASALPHLIVINGDIFETANVVAKRSAGLIDWALVEALTARAPVVLNLGNHENDFIEDPAAVVTRARGLGLTVVSNIGDPRTGTPYAPAKAVLDVGGHKVAAVGIATPALQTYAKATRPLLALPDPATWAKENLPALLSGEAFPLVLSHAGVVADRAILPVLPDGTLLVGGHDHLDFIYATGHTRYVHSASWNRELSIATIMRNGTGSEIAIEKVAIERDGAADGDLSKLVTSTLAKNLTPEDEAIIGHSAEALSLGDTGRAIALALAKATDSDVGFIGHTTLGTGFPKGDITRYDFNAIIRFDGSLKRAEIDGETLAAILAVANQDGDIPLEKRFGDFVYGNRVKPEAGKRYRIVTNDWTAANAKAYLGRDDIAFTDVAGPKLKATLAESLA